jgi:hypothetical protein
MLVPCPCGPDGPSLKVLKVVGDANIASGNSDKVEFVVRTVGGDTGQMDTLPMTVASQPMTVMTVDDGSVFANRHSLTCCIRRNLPMLNDGYDGFSSPLVEKRRATPS